MGPRFKIIENTLSKFNRFVTLENVQIKTLNRNKLKDINTSLNTNKFLNVNTSNFKNINKANKNFDSSYKGFIKLLE
jgi:hypothetical protein